jgi:hypothetical protein
VEAVVGMVLATRLPQSPRTPLEELMADADLDVLGRDDFFERNEALRAELATAGERYSDRGWYEFQVGFVEIHRYFSPAAAELRDEGKRRNLEALRARLASCQGDR